MPNNENVLLKGCALVIDNEIDDKKAKIFKIVQLLEEQGTFIVKKPGIPAPESWDSLFQFNFIILDWDLNPTDTADLGGASLGQGLADSEKRQLIEFMKFILDKYFMPIFIFTGQAIDSIRKKLEDVPELKLALAQNQLQLRHKTKLANKEQMLEFFDKWIQDNKHVEALKKFASNLRTCESDFLVSMNKTNSKWLNIVCKTIHEEHKDEKEDKKRDSINYDFNEFMINSLVSRFAPINIFDINISTRCGIKKEESKKIYNSIKFIEYKTQPTTSFEGEVYRKKLEAGTWGEDYVIDITAPCELRKSKALLIKGEIVDSYDPNKKTDEKEKRFHIIPCIAGHAAIRFNLREACIAKRDKRELSKVTPIADDSTQATYERIGRVVHPYITQIRQAYSNFISRQGIPRHPKL